MTLDAHVAGIWCGQIGGGVGTCRGANNYQGLGFIGPYWRINWKGTWKMKWKLGFYRHSDPYYGPIVLYTCGVGYLKQTSK